MCDHIISRPQDTQINVLATHCKHRSDITSNWCSPSKLTDPKHSYQIVSNEELNPGIGKEPVQIQPQLVTLQLRKGEEFKVNFTYARASNYPIDLYYIMDLSASMKDHKTKLAQLAGRLIDVMKNITTNFKLGFGSFVDKTDMPFVSTHPDK